MKWVKENWGYFIVLVAIVGFIWGNFETKAIASDAADKANKHDSTFVEIKQIAQDLQSPDLWLKNYLLVHGVDSVIANLWSKMQKGPVFDSLGQPVPSIPFLYPSKLPEKGVLMMYIGDSLATLNTLWDFWGKK